MTIAIDSVTDVTVMTDALSDFDMSGWYSLIRPSSDRLVMYRIRNRPGGGQVTVMCTAVAPVPHTMQIVDGALHTEYAVLAEVLVEAGWQDWSTREFESLPAAAHYVYSVDTPTALDDADPKLIALCCSGA